MIDSLQAYLSRTNVQLGATYEVARSSNAAYEQAYKTAAKFINASPDEVCSFITISPGSKSYTLSAANNLFIQISIGVSTTQLLHNLSTALDFQPGDELILSKLNHEANIAPWVRIAQRLGLTVKWWSSSDRLNPVCDVEELKSLLSEKTRLVTCPHASNITGTITKVKEVADVVHSFPRVSNNSDKLSGLGLFL